MDSTPVRDETTHSSPAKVVGRPGRLGLVLGLIAVVDFLAASAIGFVGLTWASRPVVMGDRVRGVTTHTLVVDADGGLHSSWIEKDVDRSTIVFASSVDFGDTWTRETVYATPNSDISADDPKLERLSMIVLHIASRHEGWWDWGGALYHHFKAPDADWKTEEIHWHQVGSGEYEPIRQYYVLHRLAERGPLVRLGPDVAGAVRGLARDYIRDLRGEPGATTHGCWEPRTPNVDCRVQGAPLLFVSPRGELHVLNPRLDDNRAYWQKIGRTNFWRRNHLIHSEIDTSHKTAWGNYAPLHDVRTRPDGLVKAVFDPDDRIHVALVSHDTRQVHYVKFPIWRPRTRGAYRSRRSRSLSRVRSVGPTACTWSSWKAMSAGACSNS